MVINEYRTSAYIVPASAAVVSLRRAWNLKKKGWIPCRYSLHVVHYQLACLMLITTADAPVTVVPRSITLPSRPPSSLLLLLIKMREGQTYLRSVCRRFTDCIMHPRTLEKNMKAVSRRVGTVIPQHNIEERGGEQAIVSGLRQV